MAARLVLSALCALLALSPALATAASPGDLVRAYVAARDAAVAEAAATVRVAGGGTPAARDAADDAAARLTSLADALRTSTRGAGTTASEAVEARIASDATVTAALRRHADGDLDAAGLTAAVAEADADYARRGGEVAAAAEPGLGTGDIVQAVGGPALLVGVVALMSWRAARRRETAAG